MSKPKLSHEQFIHRAIEKLVKPGKKSLHTVFSGFNEAFREYFPGDDPVKIVNELAKEGKISFRLTRGGALIAMPGDIAGALEKMGLEK